MTRFLPLLLAAGLFVSLTGCGQKGDLYLPDTHKAETAKQADQDEDRKAK